MRVPHGAAWADLAALGARVSQLRAELRECGCGLEQPPPHAPRSQADQRPDCVGQHALVVLAIDAAIHGGLDGREPLFARSDDDTKGKISVAAYLIAIPLALLGYSWIAGTRLIAVTQIWFIPDQRIEKTLRV